MNINELLTKNLTIVVAVIIVLIVVSVIITFMLLKVTESIYNDLELQNARLIEQVKTYTNNLAKLYEEEKMISEEQDSDTQDIIPDPDVNKINAMSEMKYQQPVAVQQQAVQTPQQAVPMNQQNVQVNQPAIVPQSVQPPVNTQQNGQAPIHQIIETTTVQGQNIPVTQQSTPVNTSQQSTDQNTVTVDTTQQTTN